MRLKCFEDICATLQHSRRSKFLYGRVLNIYIYVWVMSYIRLRKMLNVDPAKIEVGSKASLCSKTRVEPEINNDI